MRGKVLIAMSGGVDSSVAALLMRDAGYDCAAVYLRLFDEGGNENEAAAHGGAAAEKGATAGAAAANAAAKQIGIPIETLDLRALFKEKIIDHFIASYLDGETPSPCVHCNRYIKFGTLLEYAEKQGYSHVATGHYARIEKDSDTGRYALLKGADAAKDQSYMLYALSQRQLGRVMFPLGGMGKAEVRAMAKSRGLPNADRRESQDICFVPDGDYARYIEARAKALQAAPAEVLHAARAEALHAAHVEALHAARFEALQATHAEALQVAPNPGGGPIFDSSGAEVGRHKGAYRYTIGQRKGLGISAGAPIYVYKKSMADNAIYVGQPSLLYSKILIAEDVNLIPFQRLCGAMRVTGKTRYRQSEQPATIEQLANGAIRAIFDEPQRAITPGQAAVFYDGDNVVGGGIITQGAQ
ncbi:MAG: tRNA 2-thiouridine(34) synthase MnmA [Oscillospiraceae bacterium]|nr:tRNA 2-thiouridine(34) synthase MnmA [Oscillospiraceae bacterium]